MIEANSPALTRALRAAFPQPRFKGLRGIIVPAQVPREKVRARLTKSHGLELVYEGKTGALARRFVQLADSLILRGDVKGIRAAVARAWKDAKRDGFTVGFLTFENNKDSSLDALVNDTTGLRRLQNKAVEIATDRQKYRDPEKWFRGVSFLKETGERRAPKRAGEMKRIRSRRGLARRREKAKANLLMGTK